MKKFKFVVVGGGSAGMMAAVSLKIFWGNNADVSVVYDHKNPGIGVGESLTPIFNVFLKRAGISHQEMIKNCNSTYKIGLKFKNWLNDGKYFYHPFNSTSLEMRGENFDAAYDIVSGIYDNDIGFSNEFFERGIIPNPSTTQSISTLHIDATLFSKFLENKFSKSIEIIDGVVSSVNQNKQIISSVILSDGRMLEGDFFIDASGFQSILFKNLNVEWVDKSDWLPLDSCIPNPIPWEYNTQLPNHTTSEATDDGWILQVPLSNRWGTGYLFSSKFTDTDTAFSKFNKFLNKNYGNNTLNNTSRVLKFKSGYWKQQWVGNCIAVGLCSGFSEPLEATNIHHVVYQLETFKDLFNLQVFERDQKYYNKVMQNFYENVYLYLRFCYCTGRQDSEFWRYMTQNEPGDVKNIKEKLKYDVLNLAASAGEIFDGKNFTKVALGLGIIDNNILKKNLYNRNLFSYAKDLSLKIRQIKFDEVKNSIDHLQYINHILYN